MRLLLVVVAIIFAAGLLAVIALRATQRKSAPPVTAVVGALYAVAGDDDGKLGVVKVLAVDAGGVHVAMYKNKFSEVPTRIDEASLVFGTIHDPDPPGIMHLPLSHAAFARLHPRFIQQSRVAKEELEPMEEWKGGGDYWE